MPQTEKINVRGVYFDNVTMEEGFRKAVSLIEAEGFSYMVTPNAEIVEACVENPALYEVVNAGRPYYSRRRGRCICLQNSENAAQGKGGRYRNGGKGRGIRRKRA